MADAPSCRFEKFNAFIDHGQAALVRDGCGAAARLWATLWRFENAHTDSARVGLDTLAERCGTDKSHVLRMTKQLKTMGYLAILDAGKPGRGSCAVYRLLLPAGKVSPRLLSEPEIGVTTTPIEASTIGVVVTPIEDEKVSPRLRKGVSMTPVQKQKKNNTPAAVAAEGVEVSKTKSKKLPKAKGATNPNQKPAIDYFCSAWKSNHGGATYAFATAKDAGIVKDILRHLGNDLGAFCKLVDRYLLDGTDTLVNRNGHDLPTLRHKLNGYLASDPKPPPAADRREELRQELRDLVQKEALTIGQAEQQFGGPLYEHEHAA
jgi:hypothetical protein